MGYKPLFFAVLMLALLASQGLAATLHGKVYDIELNELNNVVVEADSTPAQRFVSKDGAYSFQLSPGTYTITANYTVDSLHELTTSENITITSDGDYVFDLFLLPELEIYTEDFLTDDPDLSTPIGPVSGVTITSTALLIIILAAIVFLIVIYVLIGHIKRCDEIEEMQEVEKVEANLRKSLQTEMDGAILSDDNHVKEAAAAKEHVKQEHIEEDLHKMVEVIKREGGRTTQKELRREFPLSEAKISLMVAELEHKGIIQKVKKGRGNIIILKKKK